MFCLELRALIHQCVRLGTFFYLTVEEDNRVTSAGRDEYHLAMEFEPGERMAALGRVCLVQFDAACLGRTDHGVLPAAPVAGPIKTLRIRTNHVQTAHDLARSIYLWMNDNNKGKAIRLDGQHVQLICVDLGQFCIEFNR